jgi:hypothetical protein
MHTRFFEKKWAKSWSSLEQQFWFFFYSGDVLNCFLVDIQRLVCLKMLMFVRQTPRGHK